MRILMLSWEYPPIMIGGLGRHVYELCQHLLTKNSITDQYLDIVVLTRQAPTEIHTHIIEEFSTHQGSLRIIRTATDPLDITFTSDLVAWTFALGFAMIRAYDTYLTSWIPDIIHTHDWIVAQPAISLAKRYKIPLITTVHSTEAGRHTGWISQGISRSIHSIEWWLAHSSDMLITCSNFMQEEVVSALGILPTIITTIPNGINKKFWFPNPPAENPFKKKKLSKHPQILYFGRLEYEKGVHTLIKALPTIIAKIPTVSVLIVGDGTQKLWLQELAKSHNMEEHIEFTGTVDAQMLKKIIDDSDIAVFPSIYEPFGLVALETATRGIPMIVSARSGLSEFLESDHHDNRQSHKKPDTHKIFTGSVIEPGDSIDLGRAILLTLNKYPQALQQAQKNQAHALSTYYTWESVAEKTYNLYRELYKTGHKNAQFNLPEFPQRVLTNRP